ncbi:MAG: pyridoxamine 5'-phosphate oxidase, partial [Bacteroidia bacterium]
NEKGFVFFTNYASDKGNEIESNPNVCLLFFWSELQRQVRIDGRASRISPWESEEYFKTRPPGSKIGAHASPQSKVIPNRGFIEERFSEIEKKFAGKDIPRPENWGGYLVVPNTFEFWQGRESRLHDRFRFLLTAQGSWQVDRLAP